MKLSQILRDVLILILFCAGFYLLTQAVNLMGGESSLKVATSEFSQARREADHHLDLNEYAEAIPPLKKLTEEDPYNSHAWFRLGFCYKSLFLQNKKPTIANNLTPYSQTNQDKNQECAHNAIAAYKKALDYPRYVSLAKKDISIIYAQLGERELALQYLRDAADEGGFSYRDGPRSLGYYQLLHDDPEFIEIEKTFFRGSYHQYQRRKTGASRNQ